MSYVALIQINTRIQILILENTSVIELLMGFTESVYECNLDCGTSLARTLG